MFFLSDLFFFDHATAGADAISAAGALRLGLNLLRCMFFRGLHRVMPVFLGSHMRRVNVITFGLKRLAFLLGLTLRPSSMFGSPLSGLDLSIFIATFSLAARRRAIAVLGNRLAGEHS